MGIQGLNDFLKSPSLKKQSGKCYKGEINILSVPKNNTEEIVNHRITKVAVDINIYEYKANYGKTSSERSPKIMRYFLRMMLKLIKYGIYPVFVKDGVPPKLKQMTNDKRALVTNKYIAQLEECKKQMAYHIEKVRSMVAKLYNNKQGGERGTACPPDEDELHMQLMQDQSYDKLLSTKNRLEKSIFIRPTKIEEDELIELLALMGCHFIIANGHDAENICAYLNKKGFVDSVLTNDSDTTIFGAKSYMSNYSNSKDEVKVFRREIIKETLGFNDEELLNFAIFCGTDYNHRIRRFGPATAYKFMKKSSNYEIVEKLKKAYPDGHYEKVMDEFNYDFGDSFNEFNYLKEYSSRDIIKAQHSKDRFKINEILEKFGKDDAIITNLVHQIRKAIDDL